MIKRTVIGSVFASVLLQSPFAAAVRFARKKPGFDITRQDGSIVPIYVDDADLPGVRRFATDLGGHVLQLFMHDPTVVVQSIIMHKADLTKSCFGPPAVKSVGPS